MAEWIPPKTNWQAGDIPGEEDFKRNEGNTQYLKEQIDALKQAKYMHQQTLNFTGAGTITVTHGLGTTDVLVTLLLSNEGYWVPAPTNVGFRIVDENRVAVQQVTSVSRTIRCVIIRTI